MKKTLGAALAAAFLLSAGGLVADAAYAKSDKNQAELKECKDIADPKAKDECVKQAGKANDAKAKADDAKAKAKAKADEAKGKADKVKTDKAKK